ncbi:G2 and S phase-expressed protein 1 isoform X1 [Epinephelus fuscoguttatus]|uniref:G2 and S phase-expressed protein 1 isoform X1 n=1 Tax=Epinephelus fuscoguttatus TaxID=293821 RepID=UPI0020D12B7A|nr:G2 and S phase-expressed protein 1 isoform X1 [Epinephelus fuscoguttatus]
MDCRANSDLFLLTDEKFDFDVSLSPASSKGDEDEDEVFVGPVSHKERCISVNVASRLEDGGGDVRVSWSPLSGDQLEAVCQEAHRLANQLQCSEVSQPRGKDDKTSNTTTDTAADRDEFVQDAEAKLGVLDQTARVLSPIKRQTFCVQDSPMKQLPPAVQRQLLRGSSANTASSTRPANMTSSTRRASTASSTRSANSALSTRPTASARLSTSSPVVGVKPQPRTGLRGKAPLGVGIVLPSKPAAPTTSCSASKSKVDKTRLQPPGKAVGGWRRSPSSRSSSRAGSCEDLLSDSASVASDISDSSLNSSMLGKRTLAPPTTSAVRNLSGVKAPPLQRRRMTESRNTSSSSSSMSSFNSSISLSPAKGKLNSSMNRSVSASTGPAPSSISKPTNQSRPRRSTVYATAEPTSSTAGRRSLSAQTRKLSEVERVKATKSTPLKKTEATPLKLTPSKKVLERSASIPTSTSARTQSGLKTKSKPEALVLPTPSGGVRGVRPGDDASKMLKPKRLMSVSSMDSLPRKASAGPLTPSAGSCRSLQAKARRPSALPTPVKRRISAIPVATPSNQTRTTRPPPTSDSAPAPTPNPASARRERSCSPAPSETQEAEPVDAPEIQPFCLEEEEEEEQPPAVPPSPPQPDQSESTDTEALSQGESEPVRNLIELETTEESNSKTQEVLLLDLPAPTLQPQEKLLIDLTNTPDLIRTSSKTCTTTQQLIDLSSPLIKWSPEDKRENNAPLINLSF